MMQKLRNPKNVKMVSLFVAAIFILGCFALSVTQSGFGRVASAAASESAIGVVNYQMLVAQSPDLQNVRNAMKSEIDSAQKDFDEKSKSMNDSEKQRYYVQLQERIANKEKELMEPVLKKVEEQIKKVADKKGLSVVVDKSTVIFGGVDITDEVAKSLQSGK
jgi:outer membrane protein